MKSLSKWRPVGAGLVLSSIVLFSAGCPGQVSVPGEDGQVTPVKAPNFTLPDVEGRAVSLSDKSGKVVLIDFWATWCAPCRREMPVFQSLQDEYRDRGFEVIGISLDENAATAVPPFIKESGIRYTNLIGNDDIEKLYGPIEGIPTFVIIDKEGKIRRRGTGAVPRESLEAWITELL
jgi:thiol-disulfide isomerase/thioredoxin